MIEKLILGTVQLGLHYGINNVVGRPTQAEANNLLAAAYKHGIRCLDTAEAYGDSQEVIGRYHNSAGTTPFAVITKYKSNNKAQSAKDFERGFRHNLALLAVDALEACLFHHFRDYQTFKYWPVLEQMKEQGKLKKVGVSVYTNEEAWQAANDSRIQIVQLPFNLLDNNSQRGAALAFLKENGKEVHARSVFLQGLFYKNRTELGKLEPLKTDLQKLDAIAAAYQLDIGELALAYNLRHALIDRVLIGVETKGQLDANIRMAREAFSVKDVVLRSVDNLKVECQELLNPTNWS